MMRRMYKKNRRERTTKMQHEVFLDFLEDHQNFDPRKHLAKAHIAMWREIVFLLNEVGPSRNVDTWIYILHSWRNQIKSKAKRISYDAHCGVFLSETERRAFEVFEKTKLLPNNSMDSNDTNLEPEVGISDMLDVEIKQEVCSEGDEPAEAPNEIEMIENLPKGRLVQFELRQNVTPNKVRPKIAVKKPELLLPIPQHRVEQPPEVPIQIPSQVKITRVPKLPAKPQESPADQQQRLPKSTQAVPVSLRSAIATRSTLSEKNKPNNNSNSSEQIPVNAIINLADNIQQSIEKWVESNRVYNTHRMAMDRQNAESLAVIASSLSTFSQAILNLSQQSTNHSS